MAPLQPAAQHVPAWKRLGLKLKYAKDAPGTTATLDTVHDAEPSKKRKFVEREAIEAPELIAPTKKAKKPKKSDDDGRNGSVNGSDQKHDESAAINTTEVPSHSSFPIGTPPAKTATLTKRKSVTFAPEAKTTDGDSTKDLYDRWLETQNTADANFDPKKAAPALTIHSPLSKPERSNTPQPLSKEPDDPTTKTKKKKKKRKSKSTTIKPNKPLTSSSKNSSTTSAETPNGQPHPALQYLTAYHTSPNTWKFSKNHQTYLLKHLFSLSTLPASYSPALRSYLSGLQGRSARQTIREAALKIREEDEMWLSEILAKGRETEWEKKRRREEYEAAWKSEKETLEQLEDMREWEGGKKDFEWRLKKRRRAEEVLRAVGEVETLIAAANKGSESKTTVNGNATAEVNQVTGGINVNGGPLKQPARKKRKRKRRTTGVPDDESSSSSSSSSDSDSSTETLIEQRLREALQPNKAQKIEEMRKAVQSGKRTAQSTPSSGLGGSATDKNADESSSGESSGGSGSSSENTEDDAEGDDGSGGGSDSGEEEDEDESSSSSGSD